MLLPSPARARSRRATSLSEVRMPTCNLCNQEVVTPLDSFWLRTRGVCAACAMKQFTQKEERSRAWEIAHRRFVPVDLDHPEPATAERDHGADLPVSGRRNSGRRGPCGRRGG